MLASESNLVLAAMSRTARETLESRLRPVELRKDQEIYAPHQAIRDVYFPLSGMISLIADLADGDTAEVGIVAREGMTGLPLYPEARNLRYRAAVQIPGQALAIGADDVRAVMESDAAVRRVIACATHAQIVVMSHTAACTRLHHIEQRLAWWLLASGDAAGHGPIALSQEYLAIMMGVQRPTVTLAAHKLQAEGLIRYSRAKITITGREQLESRACGCYLAVRSAQYALLPAG